MNNPNYTDELVEKLLKFIRKVEYNTAVDSVIQREACKLLKESAITQQPEKLDMVTDPYPVVNLDTGETTEFITMAKTEYEAMKVKPDVEGLVERIGGAGHRFFNDLELRNLLQECNLALQSQPSRNVAKFQAQILEMQNSIDGYEHHFQEVKRYKEALELIASTDEKNLGVLPYNSDIAKQALNNKKE